MSPLQPFLTQSATKNTTSENTPEHVRKQHHAEFPGKFSGNFPAHAELLFGPDNETTLTGIQPVASSQQAIADEILLRHWHGEPETTQRVCPSEAPSVSLLLVHGLGGSTQWLTPMASLLRQRFTHVFGLDIPAIGQHPSRYGHVASHHHLTEQVTAGVQHVFEHTGQPVVLVGLSLGGLISTYVAAALQVSGKAISKGSNDPESPENKKQAQAKGLKALALISPAYQASAKTFKPGLYASILGRYVAEKTGLIKPSHIALPYQGQAHTITRNPETMDWIHTAQESSMIRPSVHTWMELLKMTLGSGKAIQGVRHPVALFAAGDDRICDTQAMCRALEKMPSRHKKLVIFPEAAHDLVLEPEMPLLAEALSDWVFSLEV